MLRRLVVEKPKQWDLILPHAEFAYNRSKSRTTQMSPFDILYGANPNSVLDLVPIPNSGKINGDVKELTRHIQSIHEQVHQRIEASNAKYKEAADRHRRPFSGFPIILVLVEPFRLQDRK